MTDDKDTCEPPREETWAESARRRRIAVGMTPSGPVLVRPDSVIIQLVDSGVEARLKAAIPELSRRLDRAFYLDPEEYQRTRRGRLPRATHDDRSAERPGSFVER